MEWAFVAPYLSMMTPDATQRRHDLREFFSALRRIRRPLSLFGSATTIGVLPQIAWQAIEARRYARRDRRGSLGNYKYKIAGIISNHKPVTIGRGSCSIQILHESMCPI
jgi:hypothetical protein